MCRVHKTVYTCGCHAFLQEPKYCTTWSQNPGFRPFQRTLRATDQEPQMRFLNLDRWDSSLGDTINIMGYEIHKDFPRAYVWCRDPVVDEESFPKEECPLHGGRFWDLLELPRSCVPKLNQGPPAAIASDFTIKGHRITEEDIEYMVSPKRAPTERITLRLDFSEVPTLVINAVDGYHEANSWMSITSLHWPQKKSDLVEKKRQRQQEDQTSQTEA